MNRKNLIVAFWLVFLLVFFLLGCGRESPDIELKELKGLKADSGYGGSGELSAKTDGYAVSAGAPVGSGLSVGASGGGDMPEDRGEALASSDKEPEKTVTVYVCGQVENPGVYELSAGARIVDALIAAGGLRKEALGT